VAVVSYTSQLYHGSIISVGMHLETMMLSYGNHISGVEYKLQRSKDA